MKLRWFLNDVGNTATITGAVSLKDTLDIEKAVTMDSALSVGKTAMITLSSIIKRMLDIEKAAFGFYLIRK